MEIGAPAHIYYNVLALSPRPWAGSLGNTGEPTFWFNFEFKLTLASSGD
jgi:hypothetical protein